MKTLAYSGTVLAAAILLAAGARAQEKKTDKPKESPTEARFRTLFEFPKAIKLDGKQQAKLADIKKEYLPKLEVIHAKYEKLMTAERLETARAAAKKARDEGKKGKEVRDAVAAALKLSPAERKQLDQLNEERIKLFQEVQRKKLALLTQEQRAQLQPKPKEE